MPGIVLTTFVQVLAAKVNKNEYVSKLNLNLSKLQIENVFKYDENPKTGTFQIISNKNKSTINFKTNKNFFEFIFFDKNNKLRNLILLRDL